jgi:hypothetical protein
MQWQMLYSILSLLTSSPADTAGLPQPPAAPVVGPDWELIDSEGGARTYLDRVGLTRQGDVARVRLVTINDAVNVQGVKSAMSVVEIDCRTGAGAMIEGRRYRSDGTQLDGGIIPAEQRESRVPEAGSRGARLAARACSGQ